MKTLYDFDLELRILTLKYLFIIERKFKYNLAYYFEQFHKSPNAYLYAESYNQYKIKEINKTIIILKKEYDRASRTETSHKHYIKSIEHVPFWVFINYISFGTCSKMYKNMNPKEQTLISKSLTSINDPSMFATFMEYLTNIRNICAHDERLYCYICFMRPPELPLMRYFNLSNKSIKSYFGLVIVLKKFLSHNEFHFFYQNLSKLIVNLSLQIHTIHIKKALKKMGFPNNWKTIIHL
ncbi:MAG: Abi family protein [Intestinibaculum porci]|uniref:Abi family protein n=1 Tax=Intestinibaculum porci TaxID=2487118 RepID=UPI003F091E47